MQLVFFDDMDILLKMKLWKNKLMSNAKCLLCWLSLHPKFGRETHHPLCITKQKCKYTYKSTLKSANLLISMSVMF